MERKNISTRAKLAAARQEALESDPYLSIGATVQLLNDVLEAQFPQVLFRGEISQIQIAQSGHVYYTVKDDSAQIACVMWAGTARSLNFKPQTGLKVRCHGRPNIYAGSGRFQLVVNRMLLDGEGELQRRFLELKARLEQEGFFTIERKRPLPFLPKAVGIVTSKTGAVIHDMMVKLRERFPSMVVYLVDTRVQGNGAAQEIADAVRYLDRAKVADVIIVARGGGSLEDLWAFNEEAVVKAVFACSVPVVSGVGHEVDVTLCDLAADVRAPTPTAAAEMVVPRREDLSARIGELDRRLRDVDRWLQPRIQRLDDLTFRLNGKAQHIVKEAQLRIATAESRLATIRPDRVISLLRSRIDIFQNRILGSGGSQVQRALRQIQLLRERMQCALPIAHVASCAISVESWERRLMSASARAVERKGDAVATLDHRLTALSPQRVLERGYAVVQREGQLVRSAKDVVVGGGLAVRMHDGEVLTIAEKVDLK